MSVSSDPDGVDVYLDGKFVGNTPEVLKIPAGEHTLRLACSKRVDWERTIEILADSQLNLKAQLATVK